jgi:hypothetical protein
VTTRLKNTVKFSGVAPGETVAAPHLLNLFGSLKVAPDWCLPDRAGFTVTADDTNVYATNDTAAASDLAVLCGYWHSTDRVFGKGSDELYQRLDPPTFVPDYGVSIPDTDEKVRVSATDQITDFLGQKIVAGNNVVLATLNPGADEKLQITAINDGDSPPEVDMWSALPASTTSLTFVDGFAGASLSPPRDGDYWAVFETVAEMNSASVIGEIGIEIDGTTSAIATSPRRWNLLPNEFHSVISTVRLNGLTVANTVHGVFRKVAGADPGAPTLLERRLSLIAVS